MDSTTRSASTMSGNGQSLWLVPATDQSRHDGLSLADDICVIPSPTASQLSTAKSTRLRRHLLGGDLAALTLAWGLGSALDGAGGPAQRAARAIIAVAVTLAVMRWSGLYRARVCALRSLEAVRVVGASLAGASGYVCAQALEGHWHIGWAGQSAAAAALLILVLRWRFGRWLKARRSANKHMRTIVVVGANEDAEGLVALLSDEPELGYRVGGVAGPVRPGSPLTGLPSCERIEDLDFLAQRCGANGVIVVSSAFDPATRSRAIELALGSGLHVQAWLGIHGLSSRRLRMSPASGVPLLYVEPPSAARWQLVIKRAMDIVLGTIIGLAALPIIGAAAVAVKLSDGGAVMHRSKRAGRYGQPIEVLKLRTMVPNASQLMGAVAELNERKGGPLFKASYDPRVTRIGRLLRATSIDELPQLWNVLAGSMSLVGPRPALLDEVEQFDDALRRRHEMRPGMTGLWQVEARDNPSFSAYRRLDLSYVDDWSLGLDLAIMASTAHEIAVRAAKALMSVLVRREPRHTTPATAKPPSSITSPSTPVRVG